MPLFYFLVHFYLIHFLTIPFALMRYGRVDFLFKAAGTMGDPAKVYPPHYGYDLWVVYAVWIGVVAIMYPVCRWYARVKERKQAWWLSYL